VDFFDDKRVGCSDVIPALGQQYPEFFSGQVFRELSITYSGTLKNGILYEYSRQLFKNYRISFKFNLNLFTLLFLNFQKKLLYSIIMIFQYKL
jgi:hypothetical protein